MDFTASWCAPCRAVAPVVDAIAEAYAGRLTVAKVDVEASRETAQRYGIRSMPTLLLLDRGVVRRQLVGVVPRAAVEEALRTVL